MSPLRLKAGRAVDPLGKPRVAAVRELILPGVLTAPLPKRNEVVLQVEGEQHADRPALPAPEVIALPADPLAAPVVLPLAARVRDFDGVSSPLQALSSGEIDGGRLGAWPHLPGMGPPGDSRLETLREPDLLDGFRPFLEPALGLAEATPLGDAAYGPRTYQIEACRKLIENEVFLLADDTGTGKTVAVCLALQAMFHENKAARALVICQEGSLRHWVNHLSNWAAGLRVALAGGGPAAWAVPAHVYLADYRGLAADLDSGSGPEGGWSFDVVVLDELQPMRRKDSRPLDALAKVEADQRWALAGALPRHAVGWLQVFSLLKPQRKGQRSDMTLPDLRRQYLPNTLRRTKAELTADLPAQTRQEIWVRLDPAQVAAYQQELAEERHRLAKLGTAVTYTHIANAASRLKQACNFTPDTLDGAKVRALVDLVEEITAGGNKVVVLSQYKEQGLTPLGQVLEPFGTVRIDSDMPEEEQRGALALFRRDRDRHVLLADPDVRPAGGPLGEATYVVHFDHDWNPAVRWRIERRLHPEGSGPPGVNIYEFWTTDTFEEALYRLLAERQMLPGRLPSDTRPSDLEERLTFEEWLQQILEVPQMGSVPRLGPPIPPGTGRLPGTEVLREHVSKLSPEELLDSVGKLMSAWGFPQTEMLRGPDEGGGDLLATREGDSGAERLLVRCARGVKDVGVGEGRALLADMHNWEDCIGTYLVTTADFTPACKKLADESQGRLALVSGVELYRHLHLLGTVA